MKRGFSILTMILIIAGMFEVSVARHYCKGELAASRISLTGALASCGMVETEESCPLNSSGDHLRSHCCDNVVTHYSSLNDYTKIQTLTTETSRFITHVLELPVPSSVQFYNSSSHIFTDVSPPALPMITAVELTDICVFRI